MAAIARSLNREKLSSKPKFIGFCVLNALSANFHRDLTSDLQIEIRTLFDMPLAPPTKEVRHWASVQKTTILEKLEQCTHFESVRHILKDYCAPVRLGRRSDKANIAPSETSELLRTAMSEAQFRTSGVVKIGSACALNKPSWIQHLSLDEVVYDENVQELLTAVMYNSMNASFKESAVFALAAADNYDWMTFEWLKCNRPFLATSSRKWKAVPLIECYMKMTGGHEKKLSEFHNAAIEFRHAYAQDSAGNRKVYHQPVLFGDNSQAKPVANYEEGMAGNNDNILLSERLDVIIESAKSGSVGTSLLAE